MTMISFLINGQHLAPSITNTLLHNAPATSPLLLRSSPFHARYPHNTQPTRSFWWSRREWTSYLNPGFQKHIHRQHRILKYKYARALRRSALWERSPTHNQDRPSGWRLASSWYGDPNRDDGEKEKWKRKREGEHNLEDHDSHSVLSEYQARKEMFMKSFDDFKKRIDADPYGALFGRRLQRLCYHPRRDGWLGAWLLSARVEEKDPECWKKGGRVENITEDWDSAFWEIVPEPNGGKKPDKNEKFTDPEDKGKAKQSTSIEKTEVASPKATEAIPSSQSTATQEFEFDPISMRKVPRQPAATPASAPASNDLANSSLDIAVEIPVKTFKGYRAQFENMKPPQTREASLKEEITSSGPPSLPKGDTINQPPPSQMAFHATPKVINLDPPSSSQTPKDWLAKEGFGSRPEQNFKEEKLSPLPKFSVESPTKQVQKMDNIESSIDRIQSALKRTKEERTQRIPYDESDSKAEDIDLLRASDIRSSPRFARSPKYEQQIDSQERRKKLEESYEKQQQDDAMKTDEEVKELLTTRQTFKQLGALLNSASQSVDKQEFDARLKEIEHHYLGIKQELESERSKRVKMGKLESALLKEVETITAAMKDAEMRGNRKIRKASGPSTFFQANQYPAPVGGFARSVVEHEKKAKEIKEAEKAKERELVREIQSIYEDTYGVLDSKHRQPVATPQMVPSEIPNEPKAAVSTKEKNQALAKEIRSIYEDRYGKLDWKHRQPDVSPKVSAIEPPSTKTIPEAASNESDADASPLADTSNIIEKPHTTPPHIEAQIISEIQAESAAKKNAQILSDLQTSTKLQQELHETRTLLDEAKAELKLAELASTIPKPSQITETPAPPPRPATSPSLYKILAYDSSALQITTAETTSSILSPNESPLSPAEALSRLNNAAKFLPHFNTLQSAGYEIVSGTGDLLIFKKVRDAPLEPEASTAPEQTVGTNMNIPPWEIELQESLSTTPSAQTSNLSSASPSSPPDATGAPRTIKRTERVFSGLASTPPSETSSLSGLSSSSSQSSERTKSKRRSKISYVVLGAVGTGASAVAFRVVRDFFQEGSETDREVEWLGGTRKQR
jgi:hypothetical protein